MYKVTRVNYELIASTYDWIGFRSQNPVALVGSILGCIFGEDSQWTSRDIVGARPRIGGGVETPTDVGYLR